MQSGNTSASIPTTQSIVFAEKAVRKKANSNENLSKEGIAFPLVAQVESRLEPGNRDE
jgi:hypothetical protein